MVTLLAGGEVRKGLAKINSIFANLSRTISLPLSWIYAYGNADGLYSVNCYVFVTFLGNDVRVDASIGVSLICPLERRWRALLMILACFGQWTVTA